MAERGIVTSGGPHSGASGATWLLRVVVLSAFVVTLVLFGPRAKQVLAARLSSASQQSPLVQLDRVALTAKPDWLPPELLPLVARDLQPHLSGSVPILDDDAALQLVQELESVPWVQKARLDRVFPDRLHVALDLRRPVLQVRAADGQPLCLCDRDGVALPLLDLPQLPFTQLSTATGRGTVKVVPGERLGDDRVLAAAAVAVEWRDELAPRVAGCPALLEIDATNLGGGYVTHPHYPDIRIALRRSDGAKVVFAYGYPPDSELPRVPVADKAGVLHAILAAHPGLDGLLGGDLRFTNCWENWLQPWTGSDPAGPWNPR